MQEDRCVDPAAPEQKQNMRWIDDTTTPIEGIVCLILMINGQILAREMELSTLDKCAL